MSVMKKNENSVLWLLKTNEKAEKNLKEEASKLGVKPARVNICGQAATRGALGWA